MLLFLPHLTFVFLIKRHWSKYKLIIFTGNLCECVANTEGLLSCMDSGNILEPGKILSLNLSGSILV